MSVFCDAIITPYEMCPFMQLLDLDSLPVVTLGLAVEAGGGIIVVHLPWPVAKAITTCVPYSYIAEVPMR